MEEEALGRRHLSEYEYKRRGTMHDQHRSHTSRVALLHTSSRRLVPRRAASCAFPLIPVRTKQKDDPQTADVFTASLRSTRQHLPFSQWYICGALVRTVNP